MPLEKQKPDMMPDVIYATGSFGCGYWYSIQPVMTAIKYIRDDLSPAPDPLTDVHTDDIAVDNFAAAMKEKLAKKRSITAR